MSPPVPARRVLDPASSRVLTRFVFSLAWAAALAITPALAGYTARTQAVAAFGTYCSFTALLRLFLAARKGEKPCATTLNGWDESLALAATAMLAYATARLLA